MLGIEVKNSRAFNRKAFTVLASQVLHDPSLGIEQVVFHRTDDVDRRNSSDFELSIFFLVLHTLNLFACRSCFLGTRFASCFFACQKLFDIGNQARDKLVEVFLLLSGKIAVTFNELRSLVLNQFTQLFLGTLVEGNNVTSRLACTVVKLHEVVEAEVLSQLACRVLIYMTFNFSEQLASLFFQEFYRSLTDSFWSSVVMMKEVVILLARPA